MKYTNDDDDDDIYEIYNDRKFIENIKTGQVTFVEICKNDKLIKKLFHIFSKNEKYLDKLDFDLYKYEDDIIDKIKSIKNHIYDCCNENLSFDEAINTIHLCLEKIIDSLEKDYIIVK